MSAPDARRGQGRPVLLSPQRWPVRWRLAGVSAALTLIIFIVFAVVVGRLVTDRLNGDFNEEVRDNAVPGGATPGSVALGPPDSALKTAGSFRVASTRIPSTVFSSPLYVQYA